MRFDPHWQACGLASATRYTLSNSVIHAPRLPLALDEKIRFWHDTPNMKARLIVHDKVTDTLGNTIEIKLWDVAKSVACPHGYKYSLVYIVKSKRVIGYDNAEGKGDHRHYDDIETPYEFKSLSILVDDFTRDITTYTEKMK